MVSLQGVAEVRGEAEGIVRKGLPHGVQGGEAGVVGFVRVKGHGEEGRGAGVVVRGLVEIHALDALDVRQGIPQGLRLGVGDVRHHDLGGAVGGELRFHQVQGQLGLGVFRQAVGEVILHLHPAPGEDGEDQADDRQQEEKVPLIHDEGGKLHHEGFLFHSRHGAGAPSLGGFLRPSASGPGWAWDGDGGVGQDLHPVHGGEDLPLKIIRFSSGQHVTASFLSGRAGGAGRSP